MNTICKTIISLFLAVILSSCNGDAAAKPTMSEVNIMGTAMSTVKTEVVMTMTAVPTATYPPPTPTPPESTRIPPDSYADKIDYAKVTAPKIYTLLPYINKANPTGEYSGCTKTYDFHNYVDYSVELPMDVVNNAFLNYFLTEKWDFTEPYSESIPWNDNKSVPRITYDVFRISPKDKPSFERLKVILTDEIRGENYIEVRAELTHVETKENLEYLLEPLTCHSRQEGWFGIWLH